MHVCIFTHTIYGTSGNELPAPAIEGHTYAYLSEPNEDFDTFADRMREIGLTKRREANSAPRRPYSQPDGWSWTFSEVRPVS